MGYWIVLLVSLLESLAFVGLVIPGTVFLLFVGSLASKGVMKIEELIWFASIGAILGDGISFYLGRKGKRLFAIKNRFYDWDRVLDKGKVFFKQHGNKSVFLGRFIGPIRPIIPFIAGVFRMDKITFFFWNIVSAILWSTTFVLLGYLFGEAWQLFTY